jgi:drug/metabolite transporter (DMT)-like permease
MHLRNSSPYFLTFLPGVSVILPVSCAVLVWRGEEAGQVWRLGQGKVSAKCSVSTAAAACLASPSVRTVTENVPALSVSISRSTYVKSVPAAAAKPALWQRRRFPTTTILDLPVVVAVVGVVWVATAERRI